jgi:hypothetical protein
LILKIELLQGLVDLSAVANSIVKQLNKALNVEGRRERERNHLMNQCRFEFGRITGNFCVGWGSDDKLGLFVIECTITWVELARFKKLNPVLYIELKLYDDFANIDDLALGAPILVARWPALSCWEIKVVLVD